MNPNGLHRRPPSPVTRQLRQESGFGCAICGDGLIEYAHLDPPYEEAEEHDPEKMVALCSSCHTRIDKKRWPISKAWDAKKNPKALQVGYVSEELGFTTPLSVIFGSNRFENASCIVKTTDGDEWFTIEPPEEGSSIPRISAKFYDLDGNVNLEIVRNEWRCSTTSWDAEFPANKIIVRHRKNKIALHIRLQAPHEIYLERLDMHLFGTGIKIDAGKRMYISHNGATKKFDGNFMSSQGTVFLIPGASENTARGGILREFKCSSSQENVERWTDTTDSIERQCNCGGSLSPILSPVRVRVKSSENKDSFDAFEPIVPTQQPRLLKLPSVGNIDMHSNLFYGFDGVDTTGGGNVNFSNNIVRGDD